MIDRRQSPRTGRVVWRVRWYETDPTGGRRQRSRSFDTKREALDFARQRAQARRMGVVSSGRVRVADVAQRYFANLSGTVESRTIEGYRQHRRTHLSPVFGHLSVEEVSTPSIQEFVATLAARRAPATTRHAHRVLSLILDQAVAERRLAVNPAHGVRLPSLPAQLGDHVLTVDQVEALAAAVRHHATVVRVAAYCGLRWGEVAALEVGDVDLFSRRIRVQRAQIEVSGRIEIKAPKSRHGRRRVPIPERLIDELRQHTKGRPSTALLFNLTRGRETTQLELETVGRLAPCSRYSRRWDPLSRPPSHLRQHAHPSRSHAGRGPTHPRSQHPSDHAQPPHTPAA